MNAPSYELSSVINYLKIFVLKKKLFLLIKISEIKKRINYFRRKLKKFKEK